MSDTTTTITPKTKTILRDMQDCAMGWVPGTRLLGNLRAGEICTAIDQVLTALEAAEGRAEKAEAESARLRLKCGESAPEGTEIYHVGPTEYVLCPSCNYEIEDPWDEPETDPDADGWHGVITCRNCSSKIEVHSQLTHFWTARLAGEEAARRAVAAGEG